MLPTDTEVLWMPHDGPQSRFLAAPEFEVLYGGAAGGGKSDALLYGATRQIHHPEYRALVIRHTYPELAELMDRAHGVFKRMGASWNEQKKRWTFPSKAVIEFGYCDSWKDVQRYQGQQYSYIGFDEVGNLAEERIWLFLMSRCRSGAKGIAPMMRGSANPGGPGHAWLRKRFIDLCGMDGSRVYVDPETKLTRRFVPARLYDNPTLLENNPQYEAQLKSLPDMLRRQLLDGDWDAGTGLALGELNRSAHLVPAFEVPDHWTRFGAFDWGFSHLFSFGDYCVDGDGNVYKIETVTGRRLLPHEIHDRVAARVPLDKLKYIAGGLDLWNTIKARGEATPTLAEQFGALGWKLQRANVDRVSGLNNMRHYIAWTDDSPPAFKLMDTEGNRRCFDQLSSMVTDPTDAEDVLKVDADPDTGEGGDDIYDETRYALASRPRKAKAKPAPEPDDRYDQGFDKIVGQRNKIRERQTRALKRMLKGKKP